MSCMDCESEIKIYYIISSEWLCSARGPKMFGKLSFFSDKKAILPGNQITYSLEKTVKWGTCVKNGQGLEISRFPFAPLFSQ